MENDYSSTRSFALMLAHRAVGDVRRGGFRQLRNYVDLCAMLSKNMRFQHFFATAQQALERADSCYYGLIHTMIETVDEDVLCTFGVNLGFGSLVNGAGRQKECAEREGSSFSWMRVGQCGDETLAEALPAEARRGCCFWVLDATGGDVEAVVPLAAANPEVSIAVLAEPAALTDAVLDSLMPLKNIAVVPILHTPELTPECCRTTRAARKRRMLCVLALLLREQDAGAVREPYFLDCLAQEASICLIAREGSFAPEAATALRRWIVGTRLEAGNPVLMLDWDEDIAYINRALSPCAVLGSSLAQGASFPFKVAGAEQKQRSALG